MHRTCVCTAAAAAFLSLSVVAQAGNEVVFVGSSTSGSADQHVFCESATGTVLAATGVSYTDNVTDAVWAHSGRRLYVGQSLMNQVAQAEWDGSSATWSTFYSAPGACYGVEMDANRDILWTLTGGSGSTRELVGLDAALGSPTYGQVVAQTTSLSGASRERWALSWSGDLAAVPQVFLQSGTLDLVDLQPGSASYLQVIASLAVPGTVGQGFTFATDCKVSIDDRYVYLLWAGIGSASGLGVYDLVTQTWLDFSTALGHQDFALTLGVPNTMDLSLDRSFAVVSGQAGAGWAGRIDFDYANPENTTFTQYLGLTIPDANGISLSPDDTRAAVTSTQTFLSTPSELTVFDVVSGGVLQTVTLAAMWNVYTTAWQDASPIATYAPFGVGCSGSLGVPALAAQAGSRPALGATFSLTIDNLPFSSALVATGLSNTQTGGGLPLPLDLTVLGMTGCTQYVDALVLDFVVGAANQADWSWAIPNQPDLFGATFFNQAFAFDPAANGFGWTASNAGGGALGF
ncbi:MAG: hypothetical protein ACE37K_02025 [Planctomycetota bacterium]